MLIDTITIHETLAFYCIFYRNTGNMTLLMPIKKKMETYMQEVPRYEI